MKSLLVDKKRDYTGEELSPHFIYRNFGILGDAIISFQGEASVKEHLVDLEDAARDEFIYSPLMQSFLIEHFRMGAAEICARQRLFMAVISEHLPEAVIREGDDLFFKGGKLSVSVATVSPVSGLIHAGLNVKIKDCPVKAAGLEQMGIIPEKLAADVMKSYLREHEGIKKACCKVLPR